jgi:hypothetical protein
MIGLLWALIAALAILGLPRPDDDQLSIRDPSGFGDWWGAPGEVQPLYQTLRESTDTPRRPWRIDVDATRIALSFGASDGEMYRLPLHASGEIVIDARNLDLSRGTLTLQVPTDLGVPLPVPTVEVDILGSDLGSAPREVATRAIGAARIRVRAGATSVDLEGLFEVVRLGPNRLLVTAHELPAIDLLGLGFEAAIKPLAKRFEVDWLEKDPSLVLEVHLVAD